MRDAVSRNFRLMVPHGRLEQCIQYLEDGMQALRPTPYHQILGKNFLGQASELAGWLGEFWHRSVASRFCLEAFYLEMNGFAINPDQWHCNIFGYKSAGTLWKLDWLSRWDTEREDSFVLEGMDAVQEAFAELFRDSEQPLGVKLAEEIAEHLVAARFMQLVRAGHVAAKERNKDLDGIRVLASVHDWDTASEST